MELLQSLNCIAPVKHLNLVISVFIIHFAAGLDWKSRIWPGYKLNIFPEGGILSNSCFLPLSLSLFSERSLAELFYKMLKTKRLPVTDWCGFLRGSGILQSFVQEEKGGTEKC
jgi:hypothetical protein